MREEGAPQRQADAQVKSPRRKVGDWGTRKVTDPEDQTGRLAFLGLLSN